mmetsp:Transcript_21211/g.52279  ORF Transcript_21211/g.52279 Transcript_21211/m.52279 type:complete len:244 (+) Transcript_21211:894-1625(+)
MRAVASGESRKSPKAAACFFMNSEGEMARDCVLASLRSLVSSSTCLRIFALLIFSVSRSRRRRLRSSWFFLFSLSRCFLVDSCSDATLPCISSTSLRRLCSAALAFFSSPSWMSSFLSVSLALLKVSFSFAISASFFAISSRISFLPSPLTIPRFFSNASPRSLSSSFECASLTASAMPSIMASTTASSSSGGITEDMGGAVGAARDGVGKERRRRRRRSGRRSGGKAGRGMVEEEDGGGSRR